MYNSILVPLDRSTFAEQALPFAAAVGERSGGAIRVALVHTFAAWVGAGELPMAGPVEMELRGAEQDYLERTSKRIERDTGLRVIPQLLEGIIHKALLDCAHASHVDLIVVSSHGRGGMRRTWLGSVSDALLRHADLPLLIVRPSANGGADHSLAGPPDVEEPDEPFMPAPAFERVLVALDGSATAETALERALSLPLADDARIVILRVVTPPVEPTSAFLPHTVRANREIVDMLEKDAADYVAAIKERFSERANLITRTVSSFRPAEAILAEADRMDADLIAVGTHGRGQLARTMVGSVADKVIRGACVPTFVVPSAARHEA